MTASQEKTVLITGAARRVGAHVARVLHDHGMRVVIHYRNSENDAKSLANDLNEKRKDSAAIIQGDLLAIDQLPNLIEQAASFFNGLDVLINNASSFYPTPVGQATEENWQDLMGTNLKAPFFLSQAAAPYLKKRNGCIVNMADIHAQRPMKNHAIYNIAKAGNVMMTKTLARELGPEIRVNGIAPGAILWPETEASENVKKKIIDSTPLKKMGSPDDIAKAMLFLIQDADFITGQVIPVCGGQSIVL
jgi:pteridine reductase